MSFIDINVLGYVLHENVLLYFTLLYPFCNYDITLLSLYRV